MSGRRKVERQTLAENPVPTGSQFVARVTTLRGGNQCDVQTVDGESMLIIIPNKFNKKIWMKRGDFVIVDPYPPAKSDAKTRGEVAHILLPDHIKSLKQAGQWPAEFETTGRTGSRVDASMLPPSDSDDDADDDMLFRNPNRARADSSDDEEEDDDDGENDDEEGEDEEEEEDDQ